MNEPIETQIQPPLITGAERPYTLADAAIDSAKRILIHAQTCPEHVISMRSRASGFRFSTQLYCKNCGGAEELPSAEQYEEVWRARAADELALVKAVVVKASFGDKVES